MRTWDKVPDRESEELLCKDLCGERIAIRSLAVIGTEGAFSDVTREKYPLFLMGRRLFAARSAA